MADILTQAQRSERMRRIKGKDTRPEMLVRRLLFGVGYRYRLHHKDLPGRPDMVFRSRRIVVFVHGCFWHQHQGCKTSHIPKSRSSYWAEKFKINTDRDAAVIQRLEANGWRVIVVWECETRDLGMLRTRLPRLLGPP
jgi:DNA mismatch endonuclease (patch repair protein)